jgi:hypothetical protein
VAHADTTEFNGTHYPAWNGSPFDRGTADSWYSRPKSPHYYPNGTGNDPKIVPPHQGYGGTPTASMKPSEVEAYYAGYEYNEQSGGKKDWE